VATDETKSRILDTAGPVFAEKGFRDTTIRELCEKAGVGLASVNYHFRDKQQLYVQVVEQAYDQVRQHRPKPMKWPPGTPVAEKLRTWVRHVVEAVTAEEEDDWQDVLVTRELRDPTPACEDTLRRRIHEDLEPLFDIIDEVFGPELPSPERWRLIFSVLGQCLFYDTHSQAIRFIMANDAEGRACEPGHIAEHISAMFLAAIGEAPPLTVTRGRAQS